MPRRRRVLIDRDLQGRLIAAFVLLEVLILAAAVGYFYWRYTLLLDDLIYQTHLPALPDIRAILLREGLWIVLACSLINAIALVVADALWRHHADQVRSYLREQFAAMAALDLTLPLAKAEPQHETALLALRWRALERERWRAVASALGGLSDGEDRTISPGQLEQAMRILADSARQAVYPRHDERTGRDRFGTHSAR